MSSASLEKQKQYLHSLQIQQTQYFLEKLQSVAANSDKPQLDVLIEESAHCMGELGARLRIIEEVLVNSRPEAKQELANESSPVLVDSLQLNAPSLCGVKNLLETEWDEKGTAYRWTGFHTKTEFTLLISREKAKELSIELVALIKPEFVEQLQLKIDGIKSDFYCRESKGYIQVVCKLPKCKAKSGATTVELVLPETFSPSELSSSIDTRKLGVAISQLQVVPLPRRFTRLFGQ